MADALAIARSGLDAAQRAIDVIAQNASNARSIAYKQNILVTTDGFYTTLNQGGLAGSTDNFAAPAPVQRGTGSRNAATIKIMTQGQPKETKGPFDLFINGGGYFGVLLPNSATGYTRAGAFTLNKDRQIVNSAGYPLVDDIIIPQNIDENLVEISDTGLVTDGDGNELGQISLYLFPNEQGLINREGGIALAPIGGAAGDPIQVLPNQDGTSAGKLVQGSLEQSNVSQVAALTDLIEAQRTYEMNAKIVQAQDKILDATNNMYRGG